jgi:hypothetical protein
VLRLPLAACAAACLLVSGSAARAQTPAPLRVLFVANSLTTANDLPGEVAQLARVTGKRIETGMVAYDGYALEDHWNQGDARSALAAGDFDVVVMQQGPSALPESQLDLELWTTRWADEAREVKARLALLTVWPESYRVGALSDVIRSYRNAAEAAGADLYPAGAAWLYAWQCKPSLRLYGPDGFHPSGLGTYTAALVAYGGLFRAPVRVSTLGKHGARPPTVRLLQWAAARSLGRKLPASARCGR